MIKANNKMANPRNKGMNMDNKVMTVNKGKLRRNQSNIPISRMEITR